jgi:hypothetical protein
MWSKNRDISLRWIEVVLWGACFYEHFVPPGRLSQYHLR